MHWQWQEQYFQFFAKSSCYQICNNFQFEKKNPKQNETKIKQKKERKKNCLEINLLNTVLVLPASSMPFRKSGCDENIVLIYYSVVIKYILSTGFTKLGWN